MGLRQRLGLQVVIQEGNVFRLLPFATPGDSRTTARAHQPRRVTIRQKDGDRRAGTNRLPVRVVSSPLAPEGG